MVIQGPHNAKLHAELDYSYQNPSKMTICTTFSDKYLEKLGFPRWHLTAILDMVIQGPHNAKLHAELDYSYQNPSKMTICTTFSDKYLEKLGFPRWHLTAILDMVILGTSKCKTTCKNGFLIPENL